MFRFNKLYSVVINLLCLILSAMLLISCISSSNLISLSRSAKAYDFKKLSESYVIKSDQGRWSPETLYEYFIRTSTTNDSILIKNITGALLAFSYNIKIIDYGERVVLAKRGIGPNEVKSIVGAYYLINESSSDIYIRIQISQTLTGGFREERARNLGELICQTLKTCKVSYDISTAKEVSSPSY